MSIFLRYIRDFGLTRRGAEGLLKENDIEFVTQEILQEDHQSREEIRRVSQRDLRTFAHP